MRQFGEALAWQLSARLWSFGVQLKPPGSGRSSTRPRTTAIGWEAACPLFIPEAL
jgi:hypothetical protein